MRYFLVVFMIYLTACAQEKNKTMKTNQDIYSLNKDIKK